MANDKDFVVKNGLAVSGNIRVNGSSSGTATIAAPAAAGTPTLTLPTTTGTIALLQDKLSAFAATTSSELAGVISDETGSGLLVFATSPTLTTPVLGVASATSINKVAITAPATGSTLTIADGKTLTASNTLTFTGTDGSSVAFGAGGTVAYTANKLSVFAATTSAELAGVISDETGSGVLVFGTAPTFTTSIDGGATFGAFASSTALTLGYTSTAASTTNISTGAVAASTIKTINLGTGGAASSTTNINIGSANGGTTTVNNNLTVTGTLTVNGTTTTVNSTTVTVDDPIFTLGGDTAPASDDNKDRGIEFRWYNGTTAKLGFFGFDDSTGYFTFIPDATNTSEVFSGTQGDIQATNFRGALIGNADTATTLATARTIAISGDVTGTATSFNGSADITISSAITADSIVNADINSAAGIVDTKLATIATAGKVSNSATTATALNTASAIVARDASGNFVAGTITAALSGNASTATSAATWTTARTVSFATGDVTGSFSINGSADVSNVALTIAANSVALGTDTTGDYVATVAVTAGTGLSVTGTGEGAAVTLAGINATSSVKGVASFDATNFTVSTGAVSINTIDGGTY